MSSNWPVTTSTASATCKHSSNSPSWLSTPLQAFFQFAQLALHAVLGGDKALDFDAITKIEIE